MSEVEAGGIPRVAVKCVEMGRNTSGCLLYTSLFAESEGKDNKGIFPASVIFSTDLHSLGQYIPVSYTHLAEDVYVADVNGDGIINVVDATLIQKYLVRLVESL